MSFGQLTFRQNSQNNEYVDGEFCIVNSGVNESPITIHKSKRTI
jgi:hypothetical protein